MFNYPIPLENITIQIEDEVYYSLYSKFKDYKEVIKYVRENDMEGVKVVPTTFSYTPLDYQVL